MAISEGRSPYPWVWVAFSLGRVLMEGFQNHQNRSPKEKQKMSKDSKKKSIATLATFANRGNAIRFGQFAVVAGGAYLLWTQRHRIKALLKDAGLDEFLATAKETVKETVEKATQPLRSEKSGASMSGMGSNKPYDIRNQGADRSKAV